LTFTPQSEEGVTYAKKIEKSETLIDWSRPAVEVHNLIRGLSPFPGAYFVLSLSGVQTRIKALRSVVVEATGEPGAILNDELTVACGDNAVRLLQVQREGKSAMDSAAFLRGAGQLPSRVSGTETT
jgi:methionyl-tRNA formyltransferase